MEADRLRSGLGRRRACDFCCRKKIKCDAKKPTCSGCSTHGVDCVWTPNLTPKRSRVMARANMQTRSSSDTARFESIEDRLARIEAHLGQPQQQQQQQQHGENSSAGNESLQPPTNAAPEGNEPRVDMDLSEPSEGGPEPSLADTCPLPDQDVVEDILKGPFKKFNDVLPIFQHVKFMQMVRSWYSDPSSQDMATWASINVAMALGLRHSPFPHSESSQEMALACISNAQSSIDGLVYRDQDLKGLQVLLGLVVLFLTSPHPYPACVWIATAVKLVHRLRLHRKDAYEGLAADVARQRCRLFWVTYVLDRELCNHTSEPYLIRDDDFDVGAPAKYRCKAGTVRLHDGTEVNLFHLRIGLARVQGRAYDFVHSVSAAGLSDHARSMRLSDVGQMLGSWYGKVPAACRLHGKGSLDFRTCDDSISHHVVSLHFAYYHCLFSAHDANTRNKSMIDPLVKLGVDPKQETLSTRDISFPRDWSDLEQTARECLEIEWRVKTGDPRLKWGKVCALQGAIVVLAAKCIPIYRRLDHETLFDDSVLLLSGAGKLKGELDGCEDPILRGVYGVCHGLSEAAADVTEMFFKQHRRLAPGALEPGDDDYYGVFY